jgi:hypothetical protein
VAKSLGSESKGEREKTRKEGVNWKKLKLEEEIRDLLSSDIEEDECKEEGRKHAESPLRVKTRMKLIKSTKNRGRGLRKSWKKTDKARKD